MSLKEISKEELQTMGYDEIAYLVLENAGKKMKLLDLFKKVCKLLDLSEKTVEDKIGDFFELLSTNKKFILLNKGYWDLAVNHIHDTIIEDEEELTTDEINEDVDEEDNQDVEETEDEDIFYDNEIDDNDEDEDDLKDFVIIDEDENITE